MSHTPTHSHSKNISVNKSSNIQKICNCIWAGAQAIIFSSSLLDAVAHSTLCPPPLIVLLPLLISRAPDGFLPFPATAIISAIVITNLWAFCHLQLRPGPIKTCRLQLAAINQELYPPMGPSPNSSPSVRFLPLLGPVLIGVTVWHGRADIRKYTQIILIIGASVI